MVKNDERNIIPFLPIQLGGMGSALFLVAVKDEATSERHSRVMMIAMAWVRRYTANRNIIFLFLKLTV